MKHLKTVRIISGLTQADLAKLSGVERTVLSRAERGYYPLKEKDKQKIARALGLSVKVIFPVEEANHELR